MNKVEFIVKEDKRPKNQVTSWDSGLFKFVCKYCTVLTPYVSWRNIVTFSTLERSLGGNRPLGDTIPKYTIFRILPLYFLFLN